jgi:hypothetical protein
VGDDPDGLLIDANSGKVPSLINVLFLAQVNRLLS